MVQNESKKSKKGVKRGKQTQLQSKKSKKMKNEAKKKGEKMEKKFPYLGNISEMDRWISMKLVWFERAWKTVQGGLKKR